MHYEEIMSFIIFIRNHTTHLLRIKTLNMEKGHVYLAFTIRILDKINMWSNKSGCCKVFKDSYALLIIISSTIAIFADFFFSSMVSYVRFQIPNLKQKHLTF